ncbi:pyridoxal 5'-phosphate synthase glutaminase subunit PdxT [Clostridium saccharobutylicum]|uniref:Pyridoxal 5'-phosphate synthase subunit PdxT n=1 Tax=Clostridium saccharobutylicum DSM 13864 TaxID=1345695 RepID=U5N0Y9_CLOSA|nr:pyridoxal 5'-phosphate synthase glutaminase subunit PdxT [Clostridium saccharobutylicum]AGX45417.1 glutamine amidotransferase subunit PdxT [Clostridium saccharobutylicum DSM 13864]AQR92690.1 glutamine amidotransferase subunit PdxT [Clostridium saccharobutylicum]AQS02592.1 glutamine amidotransferase subunit PdxT [Clostridium saccharobutylicum]AQS12198.1 glutamine amidotransferase subunit PdxT [Clostridium saccharobutylicum]AQS16575.1 glutamine amidotransferase subunit PdxT [Clostridium sacch
MKIGVLSFQGGVVEHLNQIKQLGYEGIEVKKENDLNDIDAIILPGGESTTIGKLLNITQLMKPLREKIKAGLPTWGTCAGMILLAKEIEDEKTNYLATMDIKVKRNAFGTQIDSFKMNKIIEEASNKEIELVFIRAPYITEVKNNVEILCEVNNNIIAVKQDNMIATSFHPELTDDLTFLRYFLDNVVEKNMNGVFRS